MYRHHSVDITLMVEDTAAAYRRAGFEAWTRAHSYTTEKQYINPANDNHATIDGVRYVINLDDDSFFVCVGLLIQSLDIDHPGLYGITQSCNAGINCTVRLDGSRYHVVGPVPTPQQVFSGTAEAAHLFGFPLVLPPAEKFRVGYQMSEEEAYMQTTLYGAKLYTNPFTRQVILPGH